MSNIFVENYGRLGNAIIQIKNAIKIALFYNYNVILAEHKNINTNYIVINNKINIEEKKITNEKNFFYKDKIENINPILFIQNLEKTYNIIRKIFYFDNIKNFDENDLLIHIRSGDIFVNNPPPHPEYVMPPLSYYINIINNNSFNKIYLIAEDKLNPCINKLLELYPHIIFNIQTLDDDIKLILGAKNIVMSYGTFIPELLTFSNVCKNLYTPNYSSIYIGENIILSKINIISTELTHYQQLLTPWRNSLQQRNIMLSYGINSPKKIILPNLKRLQQLKIKYLMAKRYKIRQIMWRRFRIKYFKIKFK